MSKQRMVVEWSPHDETLFAVGADNLRLFESTCVKLAEEEEGEEEEEEETEDQHHEAPGAVDRAASAGASSSAKEQAKVVTTQRKRSFRLTKINSQVTQLKCMEWYPFADKPLMIATGMGSGKVMISDFEDPRVQIVREFAPKYNRPCNAVAWNRAIPSQIVAGFDKVRSDFCTLVWDLNTSSTGTSLIGGVGTPSSGEKDQESSSSSRFVGGGGRSNKTGGVVGTPTASRGFSTRGQTDPTDKPIHELANSEATVALSWVPSQPTCLATGTGFKWLRIYDLRTDGASAPMSVVAHTKAVLGVVFDYHRPHVLATYTDSPQEPVKVWDIRRLDNTSGAFLSLHPTAKSLSQVSWCPSKPGILVTSSPEEKGVSLWDVNKQLDKPSVAKTVAPAVASTPTPTPSMTIKKPFKRRYTSEPLASFSWQYISSRDAAHQSQDALSLSAFPNRLLTASISGEIEDISVHDTMPISISSRDCVAFSCGRVPFSGRLDVKKKKNSIASVSSLMDGSSESIVNCKDISSEMYDRVQAGYSLTVANNHKLFAQESTPQSRALRLVWQWVDQVETLRRSQATRIANQKTIHGSLNPNSAAASHGPLRGWPIDSNLLTIAGVRSLLFLTHGDGNDVRNSASSTGVSTPRMHSNSSEQVSGTVAKVDSLLGCSFYESPGRRLALLACNWDPDCGQVFLQAPPSESISTSGIPPRPPTGLYRSSSGAWSSAKQFEDASFGNRSLNEAARHELRSVVARLEVDGNYSRAAALCVFHGDLQTGVAVLQRGAMAQMALANSISSSSKRGDAGGNLSDVYQLVAMAIAGFSSASTSSINMPMSGPSLWANMCAQLLKREEIVSQVRPRYLHALLTFLIGISSASSNPNLGTANTRTSQSIRRSSRRSWGSAEGLSSYSVSSKPIAATSSSSPSPNAFTSILNDTTLALSDRVAFACRFLPDDDLGYFLRHNEQDCVETGKLEGLVLTGLNSDGIRLLQNYLDASGDVQTLALLAARLPSSQTPETSDCGRWITIYRELLNHWQLYHDRARFDVERAQLDDVLNSFAGLSSELDAEEVTKELNAPSSNTHNNIPPQLFVRCNFCNASLSLANLLRLGGSHSTWLNRAKPKLNCCPSCRKPLPQCALCLLPFGSLNPYFELAHRQAKQTAESVMAGGSSGAGIGLVASSSSLTSTSSQNEMSGGAGSGVDGDGKSMNATSDENLSQLSSIPFVEWFTWCQSCKHGGHAHHIADWFKSHSVCPVTDCTCKCLLLDSRSIFNASKAATISAS